MEILLFPCYIKKNSAHVKFFFIVIGIVTYWNKITFWCCCCSCCCKKDNKISRETIFFSLHGKFLTEIFTIIIINDKKFGFDENEFESNFIIIKKIPLGGFYLYKSFCMTGHLLKLVIISLLYKISWRLIHFYNMKMRYRRVEFWEKIFFVEFLMIFSWKIVFFCLKKLQAEEVE